MSDDEPGLFDPMNPTEWGILLNAFTTAGFIDGPPIAFHVIRQDRSVSYVVGLLAGVEDHHLNDEKRPTQSLFFFKHGDSLIIDWSKTLAVLALVGATEEEDGDGKEAG